MAAVTAVVLFRVRAPVPGPPPPVPDTVAVPVKPVDRKVVAVIIDDIGHNSSAAKAFIDMDYPVALSILPERPFSRELSAEAHRRGKTLLLHLPMQPVGYPEVDPGPGAVLLSQSTDEIREVIEKDLASLEGIVGINNHMGSKATTDPRVMGTVLNLVSERGLLFVDSRTSPQTVALTVARELGIPSARRDVFLDNDPTPAAIDARVEELLALAEKKGWAIGIGHAHRKTAQALERMAAKSRERNIEWISLEGLIAYADTGN